MNDLQQTIYLVVRKMIYFDTNRWVPEEWICKIWSGCEKDHFMSKWQEALKNCEHEDCSAFFNFMRMLSYDNQNKVIQFIFDNYNGVMQ